MNFRSFQLSDYASVTRLFELVLTDCCYEDTMQVFARQLSWDSELILVAVDDAEIVGVSIGIIEKNKGYCYRVSVHPEHRRSGIGKGLIDAMRSRFLKKGVKEILLTVDDHNERFLSEFERAGFQPSEFFRSLSKLKIIAGA